MKAYIAMTRGEVFDTFFPTENIILAESLGEIVWHDGENAPTKEEAKKALADCDVYITSWGSPKLDEELLAAAPHLKLHSHLCGSVAPYADPVVWEKGIRVLSGNRYFAESVAEGALAYMLTALRDIPYFSKRLKNERIWKADCSYNEGLAGKKIGIISYGAIAKNVVRVLSVFRTELYVYDIKPLPQEDVEKYGLKQASLEQIFSECDIITAHTPLFDATYHMIGKELLSRIKPGALLVNTSRGAIFDQAALEEELADGRFRAILDVFEQEPPPADCKLFDLPNVIMMPHMAGPTVDLRKVIAHDLLLESAAFMEHGGDLPDEITREMAAVMSGV